MAEPVDREGGRMKDKSLVDALATTLRENYNNPNIAESMIESYAVRMVVHSIANILDEHGYCNGFEFRDRVLNNEEAGS